MPRIYGKIYENNALSYVAQEIAEGNSFVVFTDHVEAMKGTLILLARRLLGQEYSEIGNSLLFPGGSIILVVDENEESDVSQARSYTIMIQTLAIDLIDMMAKHAMSATEEDK